MARPPTAEVHPRPRPSGASPAPTIGPISLGDALRALVTAPFRGRTWRELVYLLLSSMLSAAGGVPAAVLLAPGALGIIGMLLAASEGGLSWWTAGMVIAIVAVGMVPLVALVVMGARHVTGAVHRGLAAALLGEHVPEPPPNPQARRGFMGWLGSTLGDGAGWRALLFLAVSAPLTAFGAYVTLVAGAAALVCLAYPVWWHVTDPVNVDLNGVEHHSGMQFGDYYIETWPRALVVAGVGLVVLLVLPWVVRGVAWVDRRLVRGLLGPGPTAARLRTLEETRSQVVDDSAATLRRIERDLHDGTQARLVALAMQLDIAREELAGGDQGAEAAAGTEAATGTEAGAGPEAPGSDQAAREAAMRRARELVETAHRNATDAITELREVTRSIHPPILDQGLDAALVTLAAGSAVPTLLHTDVRDRPSAAIETIAYFCVAELLANVARHSGARQATVVVVTRADQGRRRLRIEVRDDGTGGARIGRSDEDQGGGLAGLADRLRSVDGRLRIDSPSSGPTLVTIDLPITS